MDDKEKRFVNELIDASLRHYASTEPRAGLEGRVLAGVRARQQATRRRSVWAWALGLTAAAVMVTLLIVHPPRRQRAHMPEAAKATEARGQKGTERGYQLAAPAVAEVAPQVKLPPSRRTPRHTVSRRVDTRPQQFPTPRPLSEQEKLLLAYAQSVKNSSGASAPDPDRDSAHDLEIPPLTITAIKIEPLAPPKRIGEEE